MTKTETLTPLRDLQVSDPVAVQALVNRRLAMRHALSLSMASTIAALAGIGPRTERVGR